MEILVGGLEHEWIIFPSIGNFIIPTDKLIFFRGVGIPPTRNMFRFSCNQVDLGNLGKLRCVCTKQGKPQKSALVLCHMVVQGNTGAPNKISKAYSHKMPYDSSQGASSLLRERW